MLDIKVGDKFNMLTVIGFDRQKDKRKRKVCVCRCECGGEIRREPSDLFHNRVKSCGCIRKKAGGLSHTIEYRMWKSAKDRAEKKGLDFELLYEDIIIPKMCPLLDIPIEIHSTRKYHSDAPSLDRINSKLGYTKENTWVISHRANQIKNDATPEELQKITYNLNQLLMEKNNEQNLY
jgi:hypothetical protein